MSSPTVEQNGEEPLPSHSPNGLEKKRGPVIGIDLGTTFSCVSVFRHGKPEIIPNDQGARTTPSQVAFTETGRLIGSAAKDQAVLNAKNTIFDAKRLIGRKFNEAAVQRDIMHFPFEVIRTEDNRPKVSVEDRGGVASFYPEEISAMVLIKMRETAEEFLGESIKDAVVTVPAYFNDDQRQATKDAGAIAGLNVLRIINEPTAAALAYSLDRQDHQKRNVLIFDLGGGTFDVTVLQIEDGKLEVKATAGDNHLGGADFDIRLMEYLMKEFKKDLSKDTQAKFRLRLACEQAKMALSSRPATEVVIPYFHENKTFRSVIRRATFEEVCMDLFNATLEPVKSALQDANLQPEQIHEVVLVGGSTRIPKIQELLRSFFKGIKLTKDINPDEVVALGAAVHAAMLSGEQTEAVRNLLLTDVIPLSLGVQSIDSEDNHQHMSVLIKRNTPIPTKATGLFSTYQDNQKNVLIQIFEGENRIAKKNYYLGEFVLSGIPPKPRKHPQIEVTFEIDANGILKVSAVETSTGARNNITITNNRTHLSKEEIEYMIYENRKYSAEERVKDECIAAANALHNFCNVMKQGAENAAMWGKLSPHYKKKLTSKCDSAIHWLNKHKKASKSDIQKEHKSLDAYCRTVITKLRAADCPTDWFSELKI